MIPTRVVAIPTEIAEAVRETKKDPRYGFPAYTEPAKGSAPCRHCLRLIAPGENAILFTYDAFQGQESLPLPGPVYIHEYNCQRYPEDAGLPSELRRGRTLNAYSRGRKLIAQEYVDDANVDAKLEQLFARTDVDYVHVRSTDAGCFTFRMERADRRDQRGQE